MPKRLLTSCFSALYTNLLSKPSMALTAPSQAKARFCLTWRALACPVRPPWRTIPIRFLKLLNANRYCSLVLTPLALAAPLRIGLVTDVAGINDKSFNQGTWEGVLAFAKENSLAKGKHFKFLQSTAEADYVPNLSTLADEGMNLIVAPGFLFSHALAEVSVKYPKQKFLTIDTVVKDKSGKMIPNIANVIFAEHEGSFLVGVAAGLKAKQDQKNVVGFVGGMKFPVIERFQAGYTQGVKAVHPQCQVLVDYAGDFANPGKGQALASKQYGAGAHVIYQAAGATGNGVTKEAKERSRKGAPCWVIGTDKDHYNEGIYAPGKSVLLTSMMKRVDRVTRDIATLARDGKFPGGQVLTFSLKEKGLTLPEKNPNLTSDALKKIQEYEAKIIAGTLIVSDKCQ